MQKINYQKILDGILASLDGGMPPGLDGADTAPADARKCVPRALKSGPHADALAARRARVTPEPRRLHAPPVRQAAGQQSGDAFDSRAGDKAGISAWPGARLDSGGTPLLLHACCAPCSSYVLEYLSQYFKITLFYYNPNISPEEEYRKRVAEVRRLLSQLPVKYPVELAEGTYDPQRFFAMAKGLENESEGGARCRLCYGLRLREAAEEAKKRGMDWFATTLSVSPYKNAETLNEIGAELEQEYGVRWLPSDFKKRGGYQRSIELSHQYGLYRQNYCGCVFSLRQRLDRERETSERQNGEEI